MNKKRIIAIMLFFVGIVFLVVGSSISSELNNQTVFVNLEKLTMNNNSIKEYTKGSFDEFYNDYKNNKLDNIYITDFLFDGVGEYKVFDLDDFIKSGNDIETQSLDIKTLNIVSGGSVELTGTLTGMIAINTNNLRSNLNIILNNVTLDTNSKKVPAVYVYNKDINYTKYKVTFVLKNESINYIEGGKFKKVSLMPSDKLSEYTNLYLTSLFSFAASGISATSVFSFERLA